MKIKMNILVFYSNHRIEKLIVMFLNRQLFMTDDCTISFFGCKKDNITLYQYAFVKSHLNTDDF